MTSAVPEPSPDGDKHGRNGRVLRVAAVQIDYIPSLSTRRGHYWLPEEPLWQWRNERSDHSRSIESLGFTPDFQARTRQAIYRDGEERRESLSLKLRKILDFAVRHQVDVVVLPEALVPPTVVDTLLGFSSKLHIFAGVGRLSQDGLDILRGHGFPVDPAKAPEGCNAAVFIGKDHRGEDQRKLVTKKSPAASEATTPGHGPERIQITTAERHFQIDLAICLDYLQLGQAGAAPESGPADLCLVTALTPPVQNFYDMRRNHATVLANHAAQGGSAIMCPALDTMAFTGHRDRVTLPSGEGLLIADYEGFETRPTSTYTPLNKLLYRAAILYEDGTREVEAPYAPSRIAANLARWELAQYRTEACQAYLGQARGAARGRCGDGPAHTILEQAMDILLQRGASRLDEADYRLLATHLVLDEVRSEPEWHYQTLTRLHDLWMQEWHSQDAPTNLGACTDLVRIQLNGLIRKVRPQYRSTTQARPSAPEPSAQGDASGGYSTFLLTQLIPNREGDPVASLPRQLDMLRAMAAEGDETVELIYRLTTVPRNTGRPVPVFDVLGLTRSGDQEAVRGLAAGIGRLLEVSCAEAWEFAPTGANVVEQTRFRWQLRPRQGMALPVGEDWGSVISYLQRQPAPVCLELVCGRVSPGQRAGDPKRGRPTPGSRRQDHAWGRPEAFLDPAERQTAAYLGRAGAQDRYSPANLTLAVRVSANHTLAESVLRSIGVMVFRSADFDVLETSAGAAMDRDGHADPLHGLRPAEALGLFHPPILLSRAAGGFVRSRSDIPLPADAHVPVQGVLLGTASDGTTIRMDSEGRLRHTHVLGRTGAGKTTLLKGMALQDLREGRGIAVVDPHGDLVDFLLGHVGDRKGRDVVLLDFANRTHLPVLNPLDLDMGDQDAVGRGRAVEQFTQILVRQFDGQAHEPRFGDLIRLSLETIISDKYPVRCPSIFEVTRLLQGDKIRRWINMVFEGHNLAQQWSALWHLDPFQIAQMSHWVVSKFSEIEQDGVLGHVLGGGSSSVSINQIVRAGGVLLVKIPKWEISATACSLLGAFIQDRIRTAVYRRHQSGKDARDPYYLYVDEFQEFVGMGFEELVAEARKFGLGLVLANQNLQQLSAFSPGAGRESHRLREALMSNVANRLVFNASPCDAEALSDDFEVDARLLRAPGRYRAVGRVLIGDRRMTLSVQTPNVTDPGYPDAREGLLTRMVKDTHWLALGAADRERQRRDLESRFSSGEIFESEPSEHESVDDGDVVSDNLREFLQDPQQLYDP